MSDQYIPDLCLSLDLSTTRPYWLIKVIMCSCLILTTSQTFAHKESILRDDPFYKNVLPSKLFEGLLQQTNAVIYGIRSWTSPQLLRPGMLCEPRCNKKVIDSKELNLNEPK